MASAYDYIAKRRSKPWRGEEEVRAAWVGGLELECGTLLDLERARRDSSFNNVVIEFKAPGLFGGSKRSTAARNATNDRLVRYICREADRTGVPTADFIGIAIDGEHLFFAQVTETGVATGPILPFNRESVALVVEAIRGAYLRPVDAESLTRDFGHGSTNALHLMQALSDALYDAVEGRGHRKVAMLFAEWRTLYGQVADMSVLQAEAMERQIAFTWKGSAKTAMPARLFVIHTYNSLLIKLLAAEIVAAHGLTGSEAPAQVMSAGMTDVQLAQSLDRDIEHAGLFEDAGISGFVEEAIFSWYLDMIADDRHHASLTRGIRALLSTLSLYRTDRLHRTRDVLRDLYQNLVPGKLRQSLGEYYTPDWLVDFTVSRSADGPWLRRRVLDPTCGSGAFLLAIMRIKRREAEEAGLDTPEKIDLLCSTVWGFDLNPLAVQTSRVNLLMELADLLRDVPGHPIELPVLLADAIYSPAAEPGVSAGIVQYQIGSPMAGLDIRLPAALVRDRQRLDRVFEVMGTAIERNAGYPAAEKVLVKEGLLGPAETATWREPLRLTYDQVLALHRRQWNGIWFRIIRNFFWSATAGEFDTIVGNPPWVRWSKLPDAYRQRVKPTCEAYGIFSRTKLHGGNELDISAMITFTVADKWLRMGGRLGFVITGAVFQNASSAGFRGFVIDPKTSRAHLTPIHIDDFKTVRPFADAANHTVVAVFKKSRRPGSYPVPYRLWSRTTRSRTDPVPTSDGLIGGLVGEAREARPVGGTGSPWSILPGRRHRDLSSLAGTTEWTAGRKGITTDLNGVYFVPVIGENGKQVRIESRPDAGKKDIGPIRRGWVEPDLLYPLIKGAGDFEACYLRLVAPDRTDSKLYTFVPNSGISAVDYDDANEALSRPGLSGTRRWFGHYAALLLNRSTYRRQMKGAPPFAIYNVGSYTFARWKVIWPEQSTRFFAAVVGSTNVPLLGSRPYVPDHKVYFAAFDRDTPAYFLCGLLNAPEVREWIESHIVSIQKGDVLKHTKLPPFEATNDQHLALSRLVKAAHRQHDPERRRITLGEIERAASAILSA